MSDLRASVADFSREVLGSPLWPHQIEAAESDAFITAIAAARRTGKTTLAEKLAMHSAFAYRDSQVLILSATQEAARRLTESIGAQLISNPLTRGAVVDDFSTRVRLSNGSEIVSLPASQRQVRGYGRGVRLVILDEAGFMPGELWAAAHYVALDERASGARILMLGTPWGPLEHFFRNHFVRGQSPDDPDCRSFNWTYKVNPQLDHEYLERQRGRTSPAEYAAEVLGEWSDAIGSLFARELLDRQTADVSLPGLADLRLPARGSIGLDWGVSFDRSAAAVIYRLPDCGLNPDADRRPRFIAVPHVWPVKAPLGEVVRDVGKMQAVPSHISTETNGVGAMPSQELTRGLKGRRDRRLWNYVATTNKSKTAGYGALLGLLEQGQLILPRHPDLLRQLAGLKFEQGERGFTRIEADDPATHDDVADALMLATMTYKNQRGRLVSQLARLADPGRAIADVTVPLLDEPIVETGGGLHVYARPVLQSVAGREATLPVGAAPMPEAADPRLQHLRGAFADALTKHNPEGTNDE